MLIPLGTQRVNPLSLNSVQDQSSPYNYPYTVKRKVMRINKMITQEKYFDL